MAKKRAVKSVGERGEGSNHRLSEAKRRDIYAAVVVNGISQRAAAIKFKVDRKTVHRVITEIDSELHEEFIRDIRSLKVHHDAILQELIQRCTEGYLSSCGVQKKVTTRTIKGRKVTETTTMQMVGDVRFLSTIDKILEHRERLWSAELKAASNPNAKRLSGLSRSDALLARLKELDEARATVKKIIDSESARQRLIDEAVENRVN